MTATKESKKKPTNKPSTYTIPGLTLTEGRKVADILQERLNALNDLALTLKHAHWNVVGPHFIAVHQMIDPQVVDVRLMVDETAERIATLGIAPLGTPSAIASHKNWPEYKVNRAGTLEHLDALNTLYEKLISAHRDAQAEVADLDPVSEDMLIGQLAKLELFHWFIRAHLENSGGQLVDPGTKGEVE